MVNLLYLFYDSVYPIYKDFIRKPISYVHILKSIILNMQTALIFFYC